MTHTDLALVTLAASCLVFLPLILLVALGIRRRIIATMAARPVLQEADLDALAARLRDPAAETTAAMEAINAQVTEMRKGFDWLVSDRMIEQAIDMARAGLAPANITAQTGISSAELAAIAKCRNH